VNEEVERKRTIDLSSECTFERSNDRRCAKWIHAKFFIKRRICCFEWWPI
jgi:hypothetical protein